MSCRVPARTPGRWISATATPRFSKSSRTTIRRSSNPTRAPRPASGGSSATSSRWGPGRLPCSTHCVSVRWTARTARERDASSKASSPASRGMETVSGFRRSAVRLPSSRPMPATRSSTCCASGSLVPTRSSKGRLAASETPCTTSAPARAATESTAQRWRRPSSTRSRPRNGPRCRSAIRSWKSSCSRRVSS